MRGAACHVPCFSQGFNSRQPTLSCWQLHSVVLHCTTLRYTHSPMRTFITFGSSIFRTASAHNHKLHSLPTQVRSTSFHSVLFHSASCRPPAAIVVLACAVVRAAGCHVFCILTCWLTRHQLLSTTNRTKQKITPALVRCSRSHKPNCTFCGFPHSSHRPPLVGLQCSHPTSCSRLTSGRPLRSPWRLAWL